jgi:asparagine synthase (glutamine-hydrolysing)
MGLSPDHDPTSSPVYQAVTEPYRACASSDAVQRAEYADLKLYMPNDPLVKVDRMSMAHSLEVRCPLLDHRLVELAFRIPASRKMQWRQGKTFLRQLARRRLPGKLWELPKKGFSAPIGSWLAGPHAGMFEAEVLAPGARVSTCLDRQQLARLFAAHRRGERDHGYALWAAWALERWLGMQAERSGNRHSLP